MIQPQKILNIEADNWNDWLTKVETKLKELGYKKYVQNFKREDFAYWKTFEGYQIGILVYDFRKYDENNIVSISFECMLTGLNKRIDLSVSDTNLSLAEFETMAEKFYNTIKP